MRRNDLGQSAAPDRFSERRTPTANQGRAFSYYANRSQSEINVGRETLQAKPSIRRLPGKLQKLRRHFGWLLVAVVACGLTVYELQLSSRPKIAALTSTSDAPFLRDTAEYQRAASALFENSAANRNKLTINSSKIAADMKTAFPELQDVSVSLPLLGSQATVYVRPADPALILTGRDGSFVLDSNGRALALAGSQTGSVKVPTVTDQSGLSVSLGKQALPRSATQFIQTFVQQLQARNVKVQSMTLPAASSELDVYISGVPYFVKCNIHDGTIEKARLQAGTFLALQKQLAGQRVVPSQYVDVRIEGRAYYK